MGIEAFLLPLLIGVDVEGATDCPKASEVKARLEFAGAGHRLLLTSSAANLTVTLFDPRGHLLGERALAREGSCRDLAEAAAVLVSAWTISVPEIALPMLVPDQIMAAPEPPEPGGGPKAIDAARDAAVALPLDRAEPSLSRWSESVTTADFELSRAHERGSQHDLSAGGAYGIGGGLTSAAGFVGAYRYSPLPWIGVEARASFFDNGLSTLGGEVVANFVEGPPSLQDMFAPRWTVGTAGALSLARGPARLAGLVSGPSLDLHAVAGIGVGMVERSDLAISRATPIFDLGGGLSLNVFREAIGVDVDIRDFFFPEPESSAGGLTHSVQLQTTLRISPDPSAWVRRDPVDAPERSLGLRFILTPKVGTSFAGGYTTTRALSLDVAFDIFDFLGIETLGLYAFPTPSRLVEGLLDSAKLTPALAELAQLRWAVVAGARVNLLRGRFSPVGLPIEGDSTLYVAGGLGIGGTRVPCTPGSSIESGVCPSIDPFSLDPPSVDPVRHVYEPERRTVIGHFGAGLHLGIIDTVAVSLELRDFVFRSSVFRPETFEPTQRESRATIHVVLAQAGVSVIL